MVTDQEQQKEFRFTREDFDFLRKLVTEHTGIVADGRKYPMYYSRLARRLRELGLNDFGEYRRFLNDNRDAELIQLVNSVTTNLTSFFRENHHFDYLREQLIPEIKKRGTRKLRIWSAGCSTGEEPYSIAMTLADSIGDISDWDIRILATDLDSNVIQHAVDGVYPNKRDNGIASSLFNKFIMHNTSAHEGSFRIIPELADMIEFRQLNLLHDWSISNRMDCIFCRNVVIYFDRPTRERVVDRFADQMIEQGYLFMGHSESLFGSTDRFKPLGKTIYQKRG